MSCEVVIFAIKVKMAERILKWNSAFKRVVCEGLRESYGLEGRS